MSLPIDEYATLVRAVHETNEATALEAADAEHDALLVRRTAILAGIALEAHAFAAQRGHDEPDSHDLALATSNVDTRLGLPVDPIAIAVTLERDPEPLAEPLASIGAACRAILTLPPELRDLLGYADEELAAFAADSPGAALPRQPVAGPRAAAPAAAMETLDIGAAITRARHAQRPELAEPRAELIGPDRLRA